MPETTMRAAGLGLLEYQLFSEWYFNQTRKQPPKNSPELLNDSWYKHWKTFVRPTVWSPKKETQSTIERFNLSPETKQGFTDWYTAMYGKSPQGAAIEPGSTWMQYYLAGQTPSAVLSQPAPQQTGENLPVVKSVGGYDWQWIPSLEGEGGIWNPLGQSRATDELTPYQREQLGLQRTELGQRQADIMNEQRRNELANRANLLARETQRLSMFRAGPNTAPYDAAQRQLADQFEQMRQLAASSTAPRNWVQQVYAQAGQGAFTNPFVQEPVSWVEESRRAKQEISAYSAKRKEAEQRVKDLRARLDDSIPGNNPDPAEIEAAEFYRDEIKARESGAKHWLLEEQIRIGASREGEQIRKWQTPRPSGATGFEVGGPGPAPGSAKSKPFTPAIPRDIQPFLEKPVWGAAVTRPSAQQWGVTPWSTRERLFGYLESQGQQPIEMLEQMERELPRNPSLGRRWQPARSMV